MDKKEKIIGSIVMIVGCTIFLVVGYILSKPKNFNDEEIYSQSNKIHNKQKSEVIVDKSNSNKKDNKNNNNDNLKKIIVEIKGEVKNPNVYTMNYGSRVNDLVKKAGGFTEKADKMSVNCSMKLKDEDCIIINDKNNLQGNTLDNDKKNNKTNSSMSSKEGKININTATKEELMKLPGVGETTANNIIDYRGKNGEFNTVEDITKVNRIGNKTLEKFKDKIEVR
ncbi:helix-hairpin-helix domain-containing protein [Clostridium botulinum]|uniref:Competence protein n=1 Tax=Clostridium botulinum C/D str. DC5 TaxID=1443128 RepID=A0A0A0IEQ8_CLOBO|nr:helix-hairpin-helix domain-containing protein [Clostridium botulinum]KEI00986.1 competence protein [Clostridium botulinum C/D str. BKT75002]KEI11152.1 competence protein [Clostridium botulinum C/D str. BKT2873]KGM94037.1 competence protein [Clostridium botulinum D str. CCUG 7971]KGM99013.1 competence protein [Clostridium botulinum C/D str. DC5]KOC47390.1 competence protein [Clostridium botulinum]